jgi:membrane-associated protein
MIDLMLDFIFHTNDYLKIIVENYGAWIYLFLFLVIFSETGFVVTPFLPGDGFLFTVGVIASTTDGMLNIWFAMILMSIAAISGNTVNYHIGRYFSAKLLEGRKLKYVNPKYLEQTHDFFEKHGQKAVILSRFLPIFRTFVPFVAGISKMDRPKFISYTIWGGVSWVIIFSMAGYFFGTIPFVEKNLSFIVLALIIITIIPVITTAIGQYMKGKKKAKQVDLPEK